MNEAKEEKTAEQILALYPALTKLLAYISGIEKTAIVLAMEEYTRDQLSKERREKEKLKELHIHQETHLNDQFEKEREMRKELVDAFKELLESDEFLEQFSTTSKEIEALIKKSSSL